MAEAATREGAEVAEKERRLLLRVPTSLIVTLVGVALTAWLLPAFTRQWDDRQKAQELRATLATDIAAASANAVGASEGTSNPALQAQALRSWTVSKLEIESRLRAYFSPTLVSKWEFFSFSVDRYLGAPSDRGFEQSFGGSRADEMDVANWLETTVRRRRSDRGCWPLFT